MRNECIVCCWWVPLLTKTGGVAAAALEGHHNRKQCYDRDSFFCHAFLQWKDEIANPCNFSAQEEEEEEQRELEKKKRGRKVN